MEDVGVSEFETDGIWVESIGDVERVGEVNLDHQSHIGPVGKVVRVNLGHHLLIIVQRSLALELNLDELVERDRGVGESIDDRLVDVEVLIKSDGEHALSVNLCFDY
jgi:hypothetical protein